MFIVDYNIDVKQTHWPSQQEVFAQEVQNFLSKQVTVDEFCEIHVDDVRYQEICEHNAQLHMQTSKVSVQIISPLIVMSWFFMLPSWRQLLDFNFKRGDDWDNNSAVTRFNDCEYVQKHQIWDWHSFAMLRNEVLLHPGIFVQHGNDEFLYITDIKYCISDTILNARNRLAFGKLTKTKDHLMPQVVVECHVLNRVDDCYQVSDVIDELIIDADSDLSIIMPKQLELPIKKTNGELFIVDNKTQHVDVQNNKPFFFVTLGFDKYHHTKFTGKHNWDTHGVYWWIANMNPTLQYSLQLTMIMGQIPNCIKLNTIGRITWDTWNPLLQYGISLWNGNTFQKVHGMIANQITDMEDRDHFLRRRRNNARSSSDGWLWPGWQHGCKWPDNVSNLMQVGIIMPGPYMLAVWKHVNHNLVGKRGFWARFPNAYAQCITMTTSVYDIYNELGIASTLKSTIEINHTTVLGCTKELFIIEWKRMHSRTNFQQVHTRTLMRSYLQEYFDGINGSVSMLVDFKTKLNVFNAMHHAYQKLIECMICLPTIVDWFGNLATVIALIRVTGALYNVNTANSIQSLQNLIKPILNAS